MSAELFLEIGTEEIPAGFLPVAMADLEKLMRKELTSARISFGEVRTLSTPRRLAIAVADVALEQERQELSMTGPSVKVAYDADGNPTKAAMGFARSNGVDVSELTTIDTEKGTYIQVSKVMEGCPTAELLPEMLPRLISNIHFKKSMRWKDLDIRFARPMHWIVALFDGQVVPFTYGELQSGNRSRGHRFMGPEEFEVSGLESYMAEARARFVDPDPASRRAQIAEQLEVVAQENGGKLNPDEALLDQVSYLVEDPTALCGSFEDKYLELPRELLITTMREHQRYFTLVDEKGDLLPRFVTISNTRPEDPKVVAQGNERVLRARLADAMFFWTEDQKVKLESRLDALKNVVYQAKLGTSYEKVMRFKEIAVGFSEQFDPSVKALTERAALLAKCDLETGMVYEFPELQGIMGREYARLEGEDARVATAICEHYLPVQAGGDLPSDDVGAFVSLADKMDTICGCFGVGLIPTGTADPYALRRNAIGILNILLVRAYHVNLTELVQKSIELLSEKLTRPAEQVEADVLEFFRMRFFNMLTAEGHPNDVVDAVLSANFADPIDARARVQALAELRGREDFEPLAVAFKRVINIIKGGVDKAVDPALFEEPCEGALLNALESASAEVAAQVKTGDYTEALRTIATLRGTVDEFFEGVMVMAKDEAVRENRLALLTSVAQLFEGIADFARISA